MTTYGATRCVTAEVAYLSRKQTDIDKKVIYKVVEHRQYGMKRHFVNIKAKNEKMKTRIYFS